MAGSGEISGVFLFQPEHLAGDVGGAEDDRAAAFKAGAGGVGIVAFDCLRGAAVRSRSWGGRPVVVHQHAAGAVAEATKVFRGDGVRGAMFVRSHSSWAARSWWP